MNRAADAVSEQRQWDRLMAMARIGAISGDGVNRACLTELDRQARRLLIDWAKQIDAKVSVDAAANLWFRCDGSDPHAPAVVTGSHMDTQPNGGRFDGIYGVIAGLEALTALHETNATLRRPIELVAWTNEEGGRFAPGCMGSMSWSGCRRIEEFADVLDPDNIRFADALAAHLSAEADLPRRPLGGKPHAYVEAHIEQGPRLESEGLDIGVVTGIQGSRWFTVTLTGETAHAGTTPLALRRDAVQDMVRAIAALNALMHDPAGRAALHRRTHHGRAEYIELGGEPRQLHHRLSSSRQGRAAGTRRRCGRRGAGGGARAGVTVQETFHALPVAFSPMVVDAVEQAAAAHGCSHMRLPSGAFHDAQFAVPVCPTGMIFVPCRRGVSHNPAEYSEPGQLAAGTRVLTQTLAQLADT